VNKLKSIDNDIIDEVTKEIKTLKKANIRLEKEIKELSKNNTNVIEKETAELVVDILNKYMDDFKNLDIMKKRELMRIIIKDIVVKGNDVIINFLQTDDKFLFPKGKDCKCNGNILETEKIKCVFEYLTKVCKMEYRIEKPVGFLEDDADIYDVIKYYRVKQGYTIEELAKMVNVSRYTIMAIENRKEYYCIKTLRRIFRVLGIEENVIVKMDAYMRFLYKGGQAIVKDMRKRLGMTQHKFVEELGVSRSSIRDWESGKKELSRKSWEKLMKFVQ